MIHKNVVNDIILLKYGAEQIVQKAEHWVLWTWMENIWPTSPQRICSSFPPHSSLTHSIHGAESFFGS